mgnify:CR=1 FL=1
MATLRDIRRRIGAVSNTAKITQAMRMVSAAKLRRAQEAIWSARPYVKKMNEVLTNLVSAVGEDYSHPLINKKNPQNYTLIVISAERGLCGSFNSNLYRFTKNYINDEILKENSEANISIIPVGKRSCQFFAKENYRVIKEFSGIFQKLDYLQSKQIVEFASKLFIEGHTDKIIVIFNEFVNLIKQVPNVIQLLPIEHSKEKEIEVKQKYNLDYIFEPAKHLILDNLLPKNLEIQLWRTLLESNAAEQAARMMAMENATTNAQELIKHLELVFNKARQASITKEMLEIVSGAEALKKA